MFTIKYLAGIENSAADIASRPARIALNVVTRSMSKVQNYFYLDPRFNLEKIDVYEDIPLLTRLKTGKNLPGLSKKQVNRIENLLKFYKFSDLYVYFFRNQTWKKIPYKEERKDIIKTAHETGHFAVKTTVERILKNFYWRKLEQDVKKFIQSCLTCNSNNSIVPLAHPARALPVHSIFDRVAMDVVGGFPETKDGYTRILVIVEYLTKYAQLYPLKTKSAEEIADKFWQWIVSFGPPKTLLTDQGTEFVNKIMDALLNKTGIERRVISAYMPNTDGLCEVTNKVMIEVLRKHAQADKQNWNSWLPFVQYCLNTKTHSTTKFTPFKLLLGVDINDFINYKKVNENMSDVDDLYHRTIQVRDLILNTRPEAMSNIEEAQKRQKDNQNMRTNPIVTPLAEGTPVLLKVEGIRGKLDAKYFGRFFISKQTEGGNYLLKNALGEVVKNSYPISKLKPIVESVDKPETSVEIEKILDDRINKETNQIEYLIKWKDYPDDENSWISVDMFDDLKMVNQYNQNKNKQSNEVTSPIEPTRRRVGRPRRQNINLFMSVMFSFLFCLTSAENNTLNELNIIGKFNYCDRAQAILIDLEKNCLTRHMSKQARFQELDSYRYVYQCTVYTSNCVNGFDEDPERTRIANWRRLNLTLQPQSKLTNTSLFVLHKLTNKIFGVGYECKMENVKVILKTYFWGNNYPPVFSTSIITISKENCENIVKTKSCNNEQLNCEPTGHRVY